jgi:hypothetical protein
VGRYTFGASQAERVVDIAPGVGDRSPDGDARLEDKGTDKWAVLESHPVQAARLLYRRPKRSCRRGRRTFQPRAPVVLPRSLSGHQRLATVTTMPYLPGIPLGRVGEQMGLGPGSRVAVCHRLARVLAGIPDRLIRAYRHAPVTHADETGGRTNGHQG